MSAKQGLGNSVICALNNQESATENGWFVLAGKKTLHDCMLLILQQYCVLT